MITTRLAATAQTLSRNLLRWQGCLLHVQVPSAGPLPALARGPRMAWAKRQTRGPPAHTSGGKPNFLPTTSAQILK